MKKLFLTLTIASLAVFSSCKKNAAEKIKQENVTKSAKEYLEIGLESSNSGNYSAAIADYQKALEIDSTYAEVYYNIATIKAVMLDDLKGACEYARNAKKFGYVEINEYTSTSQVDDLINEVCN